jgi:hypothetical protein
MSFLAGERIAASGYKKELATSTTKKRARAYRPSVCRKEILIR